MTDSASPTTPAAGWYSDPDDASQLRWWDGGMWSDHRQGVPVSTAPAGNAILLPPPTASPLPPAKTLVEQATDILRDGRTQGAAGMVAGVAALSGQKSAIDPKPSLIDSAASLIGDKRVQGTGIGAAGAALAAGGATSLLRKGGGGKRAARVFLVGAIILLAGILGLIASFAQAVGLSSSTSSGSALPGSIMLLVVGLAVSVWGLVSMAIRAGSVVGGLLLIREGWRRGSEFEESDPAKPEATK